jgi:hypothetical protein
MAWHPLKGPLGILLYDVVTGFVQYHTYYTRIKEVVSGDDYDELVEAQSRAIGALSRAIVEEIERVSNK